MRTRDFLNVKIEDFKKYNHLLDYIDDDLVLVRDLQGIPYHEDCSVRMDCFLIIYCLEGNIPFIINGKEYVLESGNVLFCLPSMVINKVIATGYRKVMIMGFSQNFLSRIVPRNKDLISTGAYLYKNPVHSVADYNYSIYPLYAQLIVEKIDRMQKIYDRHIIQYLFAALFCELIGHLQERAKEEITNAKSLFTQSQEIYRRFLDKVIADQGVHRSVNYYAKELFYTSKYLSKIVREKSGKTPSTIIHEHAIEHIKYQLKRTNKPIKQIADEFEFPNLSFFGKYVKKHLGVSPSQYRWMEEK